MTSDDVSLEHETSPHVVLIQGRLSPTSKTAIVIEQMKDRLLEKQVLVTVLDLRDLEMEFCDGRPLKEYNQDMRAAHKLLSQADGYVIGMPVYMYSVSGPLKNFLDIVSSAMKDKFTGLVCTSGGVRSYLAAEDLMNILSFEVNVTTVQPIVHVYAADFQNSNIINPKVFEKIDAMINRLLQFL